MGHAHPPRPPHGRGRACRPTRSGARLPRTRAGAAAWGLLRPLLVRGEERGRRELNGARRRVGLPALAHTHGGISRELALVATFPQLEYPRHDRDPVREGDRAAAVGAPVRRGRAAAGRRAARAGGAEHVAGPGPPHARARRWRASRTSRSGCSRPPTAAAPPRAAADPGQRTRGRLALLRAHDAALRRRGLPRRPRHRRPRAGERRAGGRLPRGGRHGRERGAGRLGGLRGLPAPPAGHARAGSGWRCARCWPSRSYAERAAELRDWSGRHDGGELAAEAVEQLVA